MREIKFRAWDLTTMILSSDWPNLSGFLGTRSDSEILMQSTGLKDKNGKEIFESDILRWGDTQDVVEWNEAGACFDVRDSAPPLDRVNYWKESVIVGNIYENPELLATV